MLKFRVILYIVIMVMLSTYLDSIKNVGVHSQVHSNCSQSWIGKKWYGSANNCTEVVQVFGWPLVSTRNHVIIMIDGQDVPKSQRQLYYENVIGRRRIIRSANLFVVFPFMVIAINLVELLIKHKRTPKSIQKSI